MIKKLFIIMFVINIFSISYSADIKMIIGADVTFSFMLGNCKISFNKDLTYEAMYESEGLYWYNKGKYSIKSDTAYLEPNICKSGKTDKNNIPCGETLGRAECRSADNPDSLYHSKFIECTSLDNKNVLGLNSSKILFPLSAYKVKSGEERVYKGVPVIVLTGSSGTTTGNVKIRKSPSIKSESLKYTDKLYLDPESKTYDFVPKDTLVNIIARTKNKFPVDKWNNYWYLISAGMSTEVWMFGEFIKLK
jgi:hypothetical protein